MMEIMFYSEVRM